MGFAAPFGPAERAYLGDTDHIEAYGEDLCFDMRSADFPNDPDQMGVLLWASIARDMAIAPKVKWLSTLHIADFDRGIVATAYDDRGLDVAAVDRDRLRPLYETFGDWLLDFDRKRADGIFSPQV
jgi:hypothetical protein